MMIGVIKFTFGWIHEHWYKHNSLIVCENNNAVSPEYALCTLTEKTIQKTGDQAKEVK
jgi:hypothetical protein